MGYYDNITLTGKGRPSPTGDFVEATGSGADISYARPIMGAFRSRLEEGNIGNGNIIVALKIELPRATPDATTLGTSDFPYNSVEIMGTIHKIGSGNAFIPQPFRHQYYFSNSEGTNISIPLTNYVPVNTVELPYLNDSGNYIVLGTPSLSIQNNTVIIKWSKIPDVIDVLFAKGTYLLI